METPANITRVKIKMTVYHPQLTHFQHTFSVTDLPDEITTTIGKLVVSAIPAQDYFNQTWLNIIAEAEDMIDLQFNSNGDPSDYTIFPNIYAKIVELNKFRPNPFNPKLMTPDEHIAWIYRDQRIATYAIFLHLVNKVIWAKLDSAPLTMMEKCDQLSQINPVDVNIVIDGY